MTDIERFVDFINQSKNIVIMTGAGISTESGIPDFRSENGIFNTRKKYGYSPEEILSHTFFTRHTDKFYEYYKENFIVTDKKPNRGHIVTAKLEQAGKVSAVITQNVDGLHSIAGSKTVYELHGSIHRNYCQKCGKSYSAEYVKSSDGIPKCECGGIIKPDVVLYEEPLNERVLQGAIEAVDGADMLIVCGSSLLVYPAAGLVPMFRGSHLVIVNKSATPYDRHADLLIHRSIGEVFGEAAEKLGL